MFRMMVGPLAVIKKKCNLSSYLSFSPFDKLLLMPTKWVTAKRTIGDR